MSTTARTAESQRRWWKDAVIYQIYPASFKDDNGDGMGDIVGIISKLDYIKSLGVTAIWLCPCYKSPLIDMGYDISDYTQINEQHGSVEDIEVLVKKSHQRGIRVLMDLVINHTSDQHHWFKESRKSRDNPYRDWYIWRDAKRDESGNRLPPTNWRSAFNIPAWTWDETTQQYYLNMFAKEQPDLNWECKEARQAIYNDAIHFWLKKGIDGFRVDTSNLYSKPEFVDAPVVDSTRTDQPSLELVSNGPRIHEYLREMYHEALSPYGDIMTVGELPFTHDREGILSYVSESDPQLSMVFQFDVTDLGQSQDPSKPRFDYTPVSRRKYKQAWSHVQKLLAGSDGWGSVFCENHDQARYISRFGDDTPEWRVLSAKVLATQMACMSGTLFIYQGQEIGMVNMPDSWGIEEFMDIDSINYVEVAKSRGQSVEAAKANLMKLARDHARIPMQWNDEANAGFSPAQVKKPWMRVHDNYKELNVQNQEQDEDSVLGYWKQVIKLRQSNLDLFAHGDYDCLDSDSEVTFSFTKTFGRQKAVICLNFSDQEQEVDTSIENSECVLSNYKAVPSNNEQKLRPWEARVYMGTTS